MARWNWAITNDGEALLASAPGEIFNFTRACCGSGHVGAEALKEQTNVSGFIKNLSITSVSSIGNISKLRLQLSNAGVTEEFSLYQIGIYGRVGTGVEKLLKIYEAETPDTIPTAIDSPGFAHDYLFNTTISDAASVTADIDVAAHVTVGQLEDLLDKNGDSSDLIVSFSEAAALAAPASGETQATLWGKVKKLFSSLKAVATSGLAADLTTDSTHQLVTAGEKTTWYAKQDALGFIPIRTYKDFTELGISASTATMASIIEAMVDGSICAIQSDTTTSPALEFPSGAASGEFFIVRSSAYRVWCQFVIGGGGTQRVWTSYYRVDVSPRFVGWAEFYTETNKPTPDEIGAVPYSVSLANNIDLNTVVVSGFYKITTGTVNGPPGVSLSYSNMIVSRGNDVVTQIVTAYMTERTFIRTGYYIGRTDPPETWNDWAELYSTAKKPTASDVNAYGLLVGSNLADGTNLNQVTTPGTYNIINAASAVTMTNCPVSGYGGKLIVEYGSTSNILKQEYKANSGSVYDRIYVSPNWSDWNVSYTSGVKPTPEDLGAAKHYPNEIDSATWSDSIAATTALTKNLPHSLGKAPSRVRLTHSGSGVDCGAVIDITFNGSTYDYTIFAARYLAVDSTRRPWYAKKGSYLMYPSGGDQWGSLGAAIRLTNVTFTSANIVFSFYNTLGSANILFGTWTAEVFE